MVTKSGQLETGELEAVKLSRGLSAIRVLSILGIRALRGPAMEPLSERLTAATQELQELEKLVISGDFSPRVLSDFRSAVDNIRQTAWAVQQWAERKQQHRDPYAVLSILSRERVRRAAQLTTDLTVDLESLELGFETEGLENLFHAIQRLHERLTPLFKKR
jgi:hypothetical protein